nr:DUF47 family protein [Thermovirga lienii]
MDLTQIANAHTMFNVMNTMIFLPFTGLFEKFVRKVVPDTGEVMQMGPRFLDRNLITASPVAAVEAVRKEMVRLGLLVKDMLQDVFKAFIEEDAKVINQVLQAERCVNELTREITAYSTELMQEALPPVQSKSLSFYVNGIGDLERIGDHAENLIELFEYKIENKIVFSEQAIKEFKDMMKIVLDAVTLSVETLENVDLSKVEKVLWLEVEIDKMERHLRKRHIERLNEGVCQPSAAVVFIDILSNLERVGDHAHNVALLVKDIEQARNEE